MRFLTVCLVLALLMGGCDSTDSGQPGELTVNGAPVVEAAAFLDEVESSSRWQNREGYHCYLSSLDGAQLNPFLRCGPVPPSLRAEQGPWGTHLIAAAIEPAGARLESLGERGVGYRLLENERLSRPDDLAPPSLDQISVQAVTGRVFETVWDSFDYGFHSCMARHGVWAFDADFTFDGKERADLEEGELVEVVRLLGYDLAAFGAAARDKDLEIACVDEIAQQAGAAFGEVAE